jgi:putative endonuclease
MPASLANSWFRDLLRRYRLWRRQRLRLGHRGELAAAKYLKKLGFRILLIGHRQKFSEIDLVAIDERDPRRTIVFVEVKTRRSSSHGEPETAVDADKERRMTKAALTFLKTHNLLEHPARFDVVSIVWPIDAPAPITITHFQNALEPTGQGQFFS